jgi:peptidoglycan hydrolase-like protein with peptidoglycan-binding domain
VLCGYLAGDKHTDSWDCTSRAQRRVRAARRRSHEIIRTPGILRNSRPGSGLTWPFVRPGNVGERVFAVQYLLQGKGFGVRADGVYGPATRNAVRSFQRSRGLNPSGNVGPSTWNRLIVTLRRGDRGSAVRALQHNLKFGYGFRFQRVSGFFGHETWLAVMAFQRGSHLPITGVVGHRMWKTIIVFER